MLDIILSLITLVVLEIVLGIDNLVILSILTERLPLAQRRKARRLGLSFAWMTRLLLLAFSYYLTKLVTPLFTLFDHSFSGRGIFLLLGGMFLIWKSTDEIHQDIANAHQEQTPSNKKASKMSVVVIQIALLDIIFSLDSVLTAVGLASEFWVMALAISISILIMIYASEPVSHFITKHPTVKILALSYLILIGMLLVADGLSYHIPRGYIYFSMGFSMGVECLNLLKRSRVKKNE
jgi:predicted tellurium resistance membrane protein TerC